MSAVARRLVGLAVAGVALGIVAGGSRWPWTAARDDVALIRLDWRARAERVEECRPPTEDEIAERPPHMRPLEICEGKVSPYALRVVVDGGVVVDDTVHGAGAREDRPLYVAREITVRPGPHDLRIDFEKIEPEEDVRDEDTEDDEDGHDEDGHDEDEPDEDEPDEEEEVHDRPELHGTELMTSVSLTGAFRLEPRQVLVVTYDPDRRRLVASAEAIR
jgi:hypothetical protein